MHKILSAVLIALCVGSSALAQTEQPKSLLSAGGARMTGGIYEVNANFGDVISGISLTPGGTSIAEHGFWAGNIHQLLDVNDQPRVTFIEFLGTAVPNPALRSTAFELGFPKSDRVTLRIYDVSGRLVAELMNGQVHAGVFRTAWDLRTDSGVRAESGIYFARLTTSLRSFVQRVVVLE